VRQDAAVAMPVRPVGLQLMTEAQELLVPRERPEVPEPREPQRPATRQQVQAEPQAPAPARVEQAPVAAQPAPVAQWAAPAEQLVVPVEALVVSVALAVLKFLHSKKGSQPNSVESLSCFYRAALILKFILVTSGRLTIRRCINRVSVRG
jgi:hypothetical protein